MISWMSSPGLPIFSPSVMPQSERLIVAVASAPHIGFLLNACSPHLKFATLSATGLVTPSIVNSPSAPTSASPSCLLYTSDAADERSSVDLGGRRIIKKKKN